MQNFPENVQHGSTSRSATPLMPPLLKHKLLDWDRPVASQLIFHSYIHTIILALRTISSIKSITYHITTQSVNVIDITRITDRVTRALASASRGRLIQLNWQIYWACAKELQAYGGIFTLSCKRYGLYWCGRWQTPVPARRVGSWRCSVISTVAHTLVR